MITRDLLRDLRPEIEAALRPILARHNLIPLVGSASFTAQTATFKLALHSQDPTGEVVTPERLRYEQLRLFNPAQYPPLGTVVENAGSRYRITGWSAKSSRYPLVAERVHDGKVFRLPASVLEIFRLRAQQNTAEAERRIPEEAPAPPPAPRAKPTTKPASVVIEL